GDVSDAGWYAELVRSGADIADVRETLVFGALDDAQNAGSVPSASTPPIQESPREHTKPVCACHGVSEAAIVSAIRAKGLCTLGQVASATRAGSSCASCRS